MLERKVGVEAEFLLLNSKDEVIVPPNHWDRDGFPLLGEIRGDPGNSTPDTVASFLKKKMVAEGRVRKGNKIVMVDIACIRLAIYKEAMKQVTEAKGEQMGKVKNIHGINIDDYSDQIIGKNHKIQGIRASCGLHIHFSCGESISETVKNVEYEVVNIPIKLATVEGTDAVLKELIRPELSLYRAKYLDLSEIKKITAFASALNRPAIEYIVEEMDKEFFDRFAPEKMDRTKYRQPGFYELKSYGFEYRSLPANNETMAALPEIVGKAFNLLESLYRWE